MPGENTCSQFVPRAKIRARSSPGVQSENTLVPTDDVPGRFANLPEKGLELKRIPCAKEKHFGSKGRRTRKVCKPSPKRFGTKTDSVCKMKKLWFAFFASRGMQKPMVYMRVFFGFFLHPVIFARQTKRFWPTYSPGENMCSQFLPHVIFALCAK